MADDRAAAPVARKLGAYLLCSPGLVRTALQKQGLSLRQPRRGRRLGEILADGGAITPAELDAALRTQRIARLRACPLFEGLGRSELTAIANRFEEVSVVPGETFIRQGAEDPTLYVLASGRVEVYREDGDGREIPLALVGPGEAIGEMGYFAGGQRNASVRAVEATQALRIRYADLTHYFENVPRIAHAFIEVVQRRRAATQERLRDRGEPTAATTALPHLAAHVDLAASARLGAGMRNSIDRLIRAAAIVTDAERGSLFLVDRASGELWTLVAEGLGQAEIRLPPGVGIAGWVAQNGEPANVAEAYDDPRFNPEVDRRTGYRTHTVLCVPVRDAAGAVVGVVQTINRHFGAFQDDDMQLLQAFADQLAQAIANLDVFRRMTRDHELLATLLAVATLVSRARELPLLSSRLGEHLAALLDCERCDLLVADRERDELWSARREAGAVITNRFPVAAIPAGVACVDGALVNIADAASEVGLDPAAGSRLGVDLRNLLAVPVRNAGREVVGVLQAVNRRGAAFGADDERLLEAIAAQVGVCALING